MTTLAEADFVGSAAEVATTVARAGFGIVAGAVYRPDEVTVPHEPATQPIPVTFQVTLVFEVPVTVALNCCWPFTARVTESGETDMPTLTAVPIETVALPTCDVSNKDVAVTVTTDGEGAVGGALYSPV